MTASITSSWGDVPRLKSRYDGARVVACRERGCMMRRVTSAVEWLCPDHVVPAYELPAEWLD